MKPARPSLVLLFLLVSILPALLPAQTPVGSPVEVGAASSLIQGVDVAMNAHGDFVVGWARVSPGSHLPTGAFGTLFVADGSPRTGEFRINGSRSDQPFAVRLAMMDDGSFVAVFPSRELLLARRFRSDGKPLGGDIRVATPWVQNVEVGSRGDGSFVVAWLGLAPGISFRAFGADGRPLGPEQRVIAMTSAPRLAVGPDGSFLVIWLEAKFLSPTLRNYFLKGQLFNADGTPGGESFLISETLTEPLFIGYDTVVDGDDNFLVTWCLRDLHSASYSVFVRRYAPDGFPLGEPSFAGHRPTGQEIAAGPDGRFVSIWQTTPFNPARDDVIVRQSAANGAPLGPLVKLNAVSYPGNPNPVLAGNRAGSFVAAWLGRPRGLDYAVIVRRFRTD